MIYFISFILKLKIFYIIIIIIEFIINYSSSNFDKFCISGGIISISFAPNFLLYILLLKFNK